MRTDHEIERRDHLQTKKEAAGNSSSTMEPSKLLKSSSSTSRLWLGMKDPRIVRVSRTFGGKDRHSKVRTVKGLRDRRVRLSVPTAIQLYDLQEKLGLTQPSKVVDWLLNAAQHEIDKLPPLQLPQGVNWNLDFPQSTLPFPHQIDTTSDQPRNGFDEDQQQHTWNLLVQPMGFKRIDDDHRHQDQIPNNGTYMGSYFHLDPSHSMMLNLGGRYNSSAASLSSQHDQNHHQYRSSSSLSLVPNSQLMLCPSGTMLPSFQSYGFVASSGSDHLKNTASHHQYQIATSSSSSPPVIPTMVFPGENLHRESSSFLNISTQN